MPFTRRFFAVVMVMLPGACTDTSTAMPASEAAATSTGDAGTSTDTSTTGPDSTSTSDTSTAGADAGMDATGTTAASDTGTSTTGPPQPICGDGILDDGESCDDMNDNPDDGCKLCTKDRIVFASSVEYLGYELDGLYGADQRCRMLAAIANLPNIPTYTAWLSDSTTAAADRITHSKGRYVLVNGLVVAADWDALIAGPLENPINVTESSGVSVGQSVFTGTLPNGQPAFGSSFCNGWSDGPYEQQGGKGIRNQTDGLWSFLEQGHCAAKSVIYCFEN